MMAIAAVPNFLGNDFNTASPGLRFGMYFQGWRHDWSKYIPDQKNNEPSVLSSACKLNDNDQATMKHLQARQQAAYDAVVGAAHGLQLDAIATAPFTTGLGNEHPTENGFAFLNPYGLAYLPGSGVKGVLRQAARELASGDWEDKHGWDEAAVTALFGLESEDGDSNHQRGALTFWDVIPQIKGDSLAVDIMTPHQKHYYQDGQTPHDSGQPIPITFLTIPLGSVFVFRLQCNAALLNSTAPQLAQNAQWQTLMQAAFEHAFNWLGFGAKTAVGYGAMSEDQQARQQRQEDRQRVQLEAEQKAEQERLATLSPEERAWAEAQSVLHTFENTLADAKAAGPFDPTGTFPQARLDFMKEALAWTEPRSRSAAAELLASSATNAWGKPKKKERWQELQQAIKELGNPS